ncbi:P-II family nitrogen regulator [Candidatus Poribacteria bacterium]|nr:P-II family nitrogen regulator [Candidatus Poribacteria bacterium]
MKKIEAIIRPEGLTAVRNALEELGYPGMTITEVKGHGKQKGKEQVWRGKEYKVEFLPKLKLEIVVIDDDVSKIVRAIINETRTGNIGDGKIFIYPVEDAIRIRTGDFGNNAI